MRHDEVFLSADESAKFIQMTTDLRREEILTKPPMVGRVHPFDVRLWKYVESLNVWQRQDLARNQTTMTFSGQEVTYERNADAEG